MNALWSVLLLVTLSGDWAAEQHRITLDMKDVPLGEAIRTISDAAGWSLVVPTELVGGPTVTIAVKDAPVKEVLEGLLNSRGLRAIRKGNLVTIASGGDGGHLEEKDEEEDVHQAPPNRHRTKTDRVKVGGSVLVEEGETVGDAVAVGGSVEVRGTVHDAVAVGGDVHVTKTGNVRGDVVAVGGHLTVDPGAAVSGDRVEVGPGAIPKRLIGSLLGLGAAGAALGAAWSLVLAIASFAILFVLGLVLAAMSPGRLQAVGATVASRPFKSALVGLLGAVVVAILSLLLVVSLVGIPLVVLVALAVMAMVLFGFAAMALRLGQALPIGGSKSMALALALGGAAIVLISRLPWGLGGLLVWLSSLICFGAVILSRAGSRQQAS